MAEFMNYFTLAIGCLFFGSAAMWGALVLRRILASEPISDSEEFMMAGIPSYAYYMFSALAIALVGLLASHVLPDYPEGLKLGPYEYKEGFQTYFHLVFEGNLLGLMIPAMMAIGSGLMTAFAFFSILAGGARSNHSIPSHKDQKHETPST